MKIVKTLLAGTAALTILAAAPASAKLLNFKITNSGGLIDSFNLNSDAGLPNSFDNYVFFAITDSTKGYTGAFFGNAHTGFNYGAGFKRDGFNSAYPNFSDWLPADKPLYTSGLTLNITDADLATPGGYVLPTKSGNTITISAVPEPATWALMLLGFGMVAGAARYRRRGTSVHFA